MKIFNFGKKYVIAYPHNYLKCPKPSPNSKNSRSDPKNVLGGQLILEHTLGKLPPVSWMTETRSGSKTLTLFRRTLYYLESDVQLAPPPLLERGRQGCQPSNPARESRVP